MTTLGIYSMIGVFFGLYTLFMGISQKKSLLIIAGVIFTLIAIDFAGQANVQGTIEHLQTFVA